MSDVSGVFWVSLCKSQFTAGSFDRKQTCWVALIACSKGHHVGINLFMKQCEPTTRITTILFFEDGIAPWGCFPELLSVLFSLPGERPVIAPFTSVTRYNFPQTFCVDGLFASLSRIKKLRLHPCTVQNMATLKKQQPFVFCEANTQYLLKLDCDIGKYFYWPGSSWRS